MSKNRLSIEKTHDADKYKLPKCRAKDISSNDCINTSIFNIHVPQTNHQQ